MSNATRLLQHTLAIVEERGQSYGDAAILFNQITKRWSLTLGVDVSAPVFQPALKVTEISDTTCAGDTYFGFFLSSYAKGAAVESAMGIASAAASLTI